MWGQSGPDRDISKDKCLEIEINLFQSQQGVQVISVLTDCFCAVLKHPKTENCESD